MLVVGQHGVAAGAEEIAVPDAEQRQDHRQVALERRGAEVLVHGVRAGEQLLEAVQADRERDRQPDRRPQGVAAADPVPEREHVGAVDAERSDRLGVGRDRHEVLRDRGLVAEALDQPAPRRGGVGHGLLGGEGLGRDHEQGTRRIERGERVEQVGAVDVGHEVRAQIRALVGLQRLAHHERPEVRAADADVDDVGDGLAGVAAPGAAAHPLAEVAHPGQHGVDVRHDVPAIHHDRPVGAVAQRDVQDRPVLGGVDPVACEHARAPGLELTFAGEVEQQADRLLGDAVLGVVEQQVIQRAARTARTGRGRRQTAPAGAPRPWLWHVARVPATRQTG